jgi:hypothetical protein
MKRVLRVTAGRLELPAPSSLARLCVGNCSLHAFRRAAIHPTA